MVLEFEGLKVPTRTTTDTAGITDPNIYADIVDFNGMVWKPRLKITNNEGIDLYFQVKQNPDNPSPARYTVYTTNLGSVAHGLTAEFTNWDGIEVTGANAPTSGDIPSGSTLEETVHCRLEAYTDSGYTNSWGYVDFDIGFVWINSNDAGWTVVDEDTFDDGTVEGWSQVDTSASLDVVATYYRTAPYSLETSREVGGAEVSGWQGFYKSFTTGAVTRAFGLAYLKWYVYVDTLTSGHIAESKLEETEIQVAGATKYKIELPNISVRAENGATAESDTPWTKVVFPLDVNATQEIRIRTYGAFYSNDSRSPARSKIWLDSVKVIQS